MTNRTTDLAQRHTVWYRKWCRYFGGLVTNLAFSNEVCVPSPWVALLPTEVTKTREDILRQQLRISFQITKGLAKLEEQ